MVKSRPVTMLLIVIVTCLAPSRPLLSQDSPPTENKPPTEKLSNQQGRLGDKFQQLEMLMLKMAEFDASSNPRRSALLKQAIAQSKDKHIRIQMDLLAQLLKDQKLTRAVTEQDQIQTDLRSLLDLLLSENRADRNRDEQDRIKGYIQEVNRILRQQRSVQGRTEGGDDPLRLAQSQRKVAERTERLTDEIETNERTPGESSEGQQSEGEQSEGEQSEGEQSEGQQSEGQQSEGQQSEGQQSEGQQSQEQPESFPGQKRIEAAEEKMREAEMRLEEAKREAAIEEQEAARELLEQAKAELEEILRQLREEEIERTLAMLESRFRKMLDMQLKVYDDSRRLSQIPLAKRDNQTAIQAGRLGARELRIVTEADKALLLLREEGSSVAFPEAVEQMHADMQQIAERLSQVKLDRITLGLEEDVIAALEEMIEALQKAQQDAEQRRQQQQQQQQQNGSPEDQALVDAIAELKMIRALQVRVNKRTQRYARLLDEPDNPVGQATDTELVESLNQLSGREERIRQITRDIVLGKNQ
ncbi:MAG: hypothetical protein GY768_15945 [Planctomycetaceae bacterium]|nr:hypothetical protein [Planctomycetaceae bacterium]